MESEVVRNWPDLSLAGRSYSNFYRQNFITERATSPDQTFCCCSFLAFISPVCELHLVSLHNLDKLLGKLNIDIECRDV